MEKKDWSQLALINNDRAPKKRFELHVENQIVFIEYILAKGDSIYLTHTEVPVSLEGNGLGSAIIKKTLEYIRKKGYQLVPLCPFVAAYIKKHPEAGKGILKSGYSV
ncbi:GNAT family N-acetyltransferase [Aquimarina gracilis]|uniref:GNAT family N-acetyltransferase n=1 Tax=Aquimarina gracilis TaxID=874422 RepID=A0ABU5ZTP5_9FLAO|nr:GNAT family N-acetyltransferase [Aquimarina gracilis]MEB3344912.1 GNAT family N-acetyltransferase [Aquimarina gracilis]